jgi:thymidine kinase
VNRISIDGPPKSGKTKTLIDLANDLHIAGRKVTFVGENTNEIIHQMGLRKDIPYRTVSRDEREHLEVRGG